MVIFLHLLLLVMNSLGFMVVRLLEELLEGLVVLPEVLVHRNQVLEAAHDRVVLRLFQGFHTPSGSRYRTEEAYQGHRGEKQEAGGPPG